MEIAQCSKCGMTFKDAESIDQVNKKWREEGYAPCPKLTCSGQMVIKRQSWITELQTASA